MPVDRSVQYFLTQNRNWLGEIQPVGLVVAPIALADAGLAPDRERTIEAQLSLQDIIRTDATGELTDGELWCDDFVRFATEVLRWFDSDIAAPDDRTQVALPEAQEVLEPDFIVYDALADDDRTPLILIKTLPTGTNWDIKPTDTATGWQATPQAKFERLLRETEVPIGLLFNGVALRLVYAPRGESSGYMTFPIAPMVTVAGRSLLGAMVMLLGGEMLFIENRDNASQRLPELLAASRKAQAAVTVKLSEQVLDALWDLLRGFQAADADANGSVLGDLGLSDPQHIYGGLVTVMMRLVFLLYAEERDIMPGDDLYQQNYSVVGLYEKLRRDVGNYPDTIDQRFGAWSWLLSLFRLVYDGGGMTKEYLPARDGQLFDPDAYPFLEGRSRGDRYCLCDADGLPILRHGERVPLPVKVAPRVSDGVVFRILDRMLMVDGERLTYRALDVEHIGSVYEGIMGYEVERAAAESIAVTSKPAGSKVSVPVVIDLVALLAAKPNDRKKCLKEWANCEMTATANKALKEAKSIEDLVSALGRRISPKTPGILSVGSLCLQPGEERRRSGSHYTPRELTEPIVSTTLAPIWAKLRAESALTADRVLALKVCDLAMGSGAFLVEVCRQLADRLVNCWEREAIDSLTPEEAAEGIQTDRLIQARRLVAQQCLYGVDKNPFAVNLAKLSLWLFTLSRDESFTFLDHALKLGDSLVGFIGDEIATFGSQTSINKGKKRRFENHRDQLRGNKNSKQKYVIFEELEDILKLPRLVASLQVVPFFEGLNKAEKKMRLKEYEALLIELNLSEDLSPLEKITHRLQALDRPLTPFNWTIEFPEVFDLKDRQKNPGFDVIVGNPPFAGKNTIAAGHPPGFLDYLKEHYEESHGNSDFVAYFFRRAFTLLRHGGTFGLIATNTIAQGDTRSTGLRYLCQRGGKIYNAKTRFKWPGLAAVVVSIVHIWKD